MHIAMSPYEERLGQGADRVTIQAVFDELYADETRLQALLNDGLAPGEHRRIQRLLEAVRVAQEVMVDAVLANGHEL